MLENCKFLTCFHPFQGTSSSRRGPKPADDPLTVQNILLSYKDRIVINGKVVAKWDPVWEEIRSAHSLKTSTNGLNAFVVCNRGPTGGILKELGLKPPGEVDSEVDEPVSEASEGHVIDSDTSFHSVSGNVINRRLFIPKDKWNIIKPKEVTYKRNDPSRKTQDRTYLVLEEGIWAKALRIQIHKETKLPCSWSFKKHSVAITDEAQYYLKFKATCGCGGKLYATCPNPLPADPNKEGLHLDVVIYDAKMEPHSDVTKVQISGPERTQLGSRMLVEGLSASLLRKEYAGEHMEMFDLEPGGVPLLSTLRRIKSDALSVQKLAPSAIESVELLKYSNDWKFSIFDIGHNSFFVHYFLPEQLQLYNEYASKAYCRIITDASSKIAHKLPRPIGQSGNLFLYSIVISIPGEHEGQVPVAQMISERQHTNGIAFWFNEWIRRGAKPPKEIVVDNSPAFLLALSKVFGHVRGTEEYIDMCFKNLTQPNSFPPPPVLIRIDIAHLIKRLTQWKSIKDMRKRCKEFYMRSIYLIVLAKELNEAESIIESIFIVASNETEGTSDSTLEETPCELHKKKLLDLIGKERAVFNLVDDALNTEEGEDDSIDPDDPDDPDDPVVREECDQISPQLQFNSWLNRLYLDSIAEKNIVVDGDRDNLMFSIPFRNAFLELCYKMLLWSNVMARALQSPYQNAVGAHVESHFKDLKTNLIRKQLRVDLFVQKHLKILRDTMVLASGLGFFHKEERCVLCLTGNLPHPTHASACIVCARRVHDHVSCSTLQDDMTRICVSCTLVTSERGRI